MKTINNDFEQDTFAEWHDSPEALRHYFLNNGNFERLEKGELGGKLNLKFQWRALLECHKEFSNVILKTGTNLNSKNGLGIEVNQQQELIEFVNSSVLDFSVKPHEIGQEQVKTFHYNFLAWRQNNYKTPLHEHYTDKEISYRFFMDQAHEEALMKLISQYSHENRLATYRKMGDYSNFTDLFYDIEIV